MRNIATIAVGLLLSGCYRPAIEVADMLKPMLQANLDTEKLTKDAHLTVAEITVIREEGNRYGALVTVMMDGEKHEVLLKVLADDKHIIYEAPPSAFFFAAQHALEMALSPTPIQNAAPAAWDSSALTEQAEACSIGLLPHVREGYLKSAAARGDTSGVFPVEKVGPLIADTCLCLVQNASKKYSVVEYRSRREAIMASGFEKMMNGSECALAFH